MFMCEATILILDNLVAIDFLFYMCNSMLLSLKESKY